MLESAIEWLHQHSNWQVILAIAGLILAIWKFYFRAYQNKLEAAVGGPVRLLDSRAHYSQVEVSELFHRLGQAGRNLYRRIVGRIDMVFPLIYGLFMVLILAHLLAAVGNAKYYPLILLPVVGVICDYLENFNTLYLLSRYPDLPKSLVKRGAWLTTLKWVMVVGSLLVAGVLLFQVILSGAEYGNG